MISKEFLEFNKTQLSPFIKLFEKAWFFYANFQVSTYIKYLVMCIPYYTIQHNVDYVVQ